MTDVVRVFGDPDDLDPSIYCCSRCGKAWTSMAAARFCCAED